MRQVHFADFRPQAAIHLNRLLKQRNEGMGLKPVLDAVLYHHENHDGSGYPSGLRGDEIPLFARILRVVDIFDALTSTRAYRAGMSADEALETIAKGAGTVSDPRVSQAFSDALREHIAAGSEEFRRLFPHFFETDLEAPVAGSATGSLSQCT